MKSSNTGRRYDAAFKAQSVELLLSSAKTVNQLATELGLGHATLERCGTASAGILFRVGRGIGEEQSELDRIPNDSSSK